MSDLTSFTALIPRDHGLCVVVTRRSDHTPHATVVNAGVLHHPLTGAPVVGLVCAAGTRKLVHLRADPSIALTIRAGWQWSTVEGRAELFGPDDPHPAIDGEGLRLLLRAVFVAAGGAHDDWDAYDRVMHDERRAVVLVTATRVYGNPM